MDKKNIHELVAKWSNKEEVGGLSVENLSEEMKEQMAVCLENVDSQKAVAINEDFTNSTTGIGELGSTAAYKPISLALFRRTLPYLFAQKTIGLQSMSTPVGLAYALRVIYAHKDGVNGPEAAWDQVPVYSGFTGSTSGFSATYSISGAGTGVDTSVAEAWKIGTDYPQLKLILQSLAIAAKTRKLGASFSLESAQDIQAMHNIDIQREIVKVLQYEIIAEMDRELLSKLKVTACTASGGEAAGILDLGATSGTSYVDGRWSQEKISALVTAIIHQSNKIAITTRRGRGNFVIVSPAIATVLGSARPSFQGNNVSVDQINTSVAEIGTLNNTIKVYLDQYATDDYFLVGYKGPDNNDCGIILSPYVQNAMSTAVDPNDFSPRIGVMSRYALTDSLLGAGRYYRYTRCLNLSGSGIIAGY